MRILIGLAVLASVAVLVAAGGSSRHIGAPLQKRLAAVARRTAGSLSDSAELKTASVYGPASYRAAENAVDGVTTTNRKPGRFYVIVIRGHFVCGWCPRPAAAPSPHGSIATKIWSPNGHGGGFGIRRTLPASLSRLGRPIRIDLN